MHVLLEASSVCENFVNNFLVHYLAELKNSYNHPTKELSPETLHLDFEDDDHQIPCNLE